MVGMTEFESVLRESQSRVLTVNTTIPVKWSSWTALNRRPMLYESIALPTELQEHTQLGIEPRITIWLPTPPFGVSDLPCYHYTTAKIMI